MGTPVIITGMHRSGTSLLANLLQAAGVDIGDRLMEPTRFNPKGYFEDMDFYNLHVDILHDNGRYLVYGIGDDLEVKVSSEYEARAQELIQARQDRDLWGWKDPRSSLIPEFWARLLPEARFVFIYRDPELVVDSLRRRADGPLMHQFRGVKLLERFGFDRFSPKLALNMWKYYNRHIVDYAERHPDTCHVLALENLAEEFPRAIERMRRDWKLDLKDVDLQSVFEKQLLGAEAPAAIRRTCRRDPEAGSLMARLRVLSGSGDDIPLVAATGVRRVGGALVRQLRRWFTAEGRHAARSLRAQAFEGDYSQWLKSFDTPQPHELDAMRRRAESAGGDPTRFWIHLSNADSRAREALEQQTWPHWRLIDGDLREFLDKGEAAAQDWLMVLDRGQVLPRHSLQTFAESAAVRRGAQVVYGDEDRIAGDQSRHTPFFKPDWSPDFYLESDYISSSCILSLGRARQVLGRHPFIGGHDLVGHMLEDCLEGGVEHIPLILAHVPDGHELSGEKRRERIAALVSRWEGVDVDIEETDRGGHRLIYPLPDELPQVTVIVPTRDRLRELKACLTTLLEKTTYPKFNAVVVDNGSVQEATLAYLEEVSQDRRVTIERDPREFNFSAINNQAAQGARGEVLCFLNDDTRIISESWLTDMVRLALRPRIGAVGAMLFYADGSIQHAGVVTGSGGARLAGHPFRGQKPEEHPDNPRLHHVQNYSVVTGACLMVRREIFEAVGGFPEELSVCFNDVDLCLKIKEQGFRNIWTPHVQLHHDENVSYAARGREEQARYDRESAWLWRKWHNTLPVDPAFNPNLALSGDIGALAANPRADRPWK